VSGWMVDEGICRFYPVFRLLFRPFVSRLQMRFDARYIRQASRRHGGLGLLSCIERTVSRAYTRGTKKNCFAAGAAIDQIMYFITLCGDTK
jgi:hypothetical protein